MPLLEYGDVPKCSLANEKKSWDNFDHLLKRLGVRQVILRGKNFRLANIDMRILNDAEREYAVRNRLVYKKGKDEFAQNLPYHCVGYSQVELENRGYRVLQSNVVHTLKPPSI